MNLLAGFGAGYAQWGLYDNERALRVGHDLGRATLLQAAIATFAVKACFEAISLPPSPSLQLAAIALPAYVSYVIQQIDNSNHSGSQTLRNWLYPVHRNLGKVAFGSYLLSQIGTVHITPLQSAGSLLGVLATHQVIQSNLSANQKRLFFWTAFSLCIYNDWAKGEWFLTLLGATTLIDSCARTWQTNKSFQRPRSPREMTEEELRQKDDLSSLEVVKSRFFSDEVAELPPPPEGAQICSLLTHFGGVKWENHQELIKAQCEDDEKWSREIGSGDKIAYLREGIQKYIDGVEGRSNPEGIVLDRTELSRRALLLTDLLPNLPEENQALLLIKMGLMGHLCGIGWLSNSDEFYREFAPEGKRLTLQERYLLQLARVRRDLLLQVVRDKVSSSNRLIQWYFDPTRLHNANFLIHCFGERLGLAGQSMANQDWTSRPSWAERGLILEWSPFEKEFWRHYTPLLILEQTEIWMGKNGDEVSEWFRDHLPGKSIDEKLEQYERLTPKKRTLLFATKMGELKLNERCASLRGSREDLSSSPRE